MDLSTLQTRVLQRLDDTSGTHYTTAEVTDAINKGNRLMCFLTLCVERTGNLTVSANTPFVLPRTTFTDWLMPLRIAIPASGKKIKPSRFHELNLLNNLWMTANGEPQNYFSLGQNFLGFTPTVSSGSTVLSVTYAAVPSVLSSGGDVPEAPVEYHGEIAEYAYYHVRQKEGGAEAASTLPHLQRFLEACQKLGDFTRAKAKAQAYDAECFDLASFDKSSLFRMKLDGKKAAA